MSDNTSPCLLAEFWGQRLHRRVDPAAVFHRDMGFQRYDVALYPVWSFVNNADGYCARPRCRQNSFCRVDEVRLFDGLCQAASNTSLAGKHRNWHLPESILREKRFKGFSPYQPLVVSRLLAQPGSAVPALDKDEPL